MKAKPYENVGLRICEKNRDTFGKAYKTYYQYSKIPITSNKT